MRSDLHDKSVMKVAKKGKRKLSCQIVKDEFVHDGIAKGKSLKALLSPWFWKSKTKMGNTEMFVI